MTWWVFVIVIYVHPGAVPAHVIRAFETQAQCERARWALQIKNASSTYVLGCEPITVEARK